MSEKIKDLFLTLKGIFLYLRKYRKSCYWPQEKMEHYQYDKLKKLLMVCEKDIPYYKHLFRKIGFDVERDFKSLSDLSRVPITTKDNVKKHMTEFINPNYVGKAMTLETSGSTGMPLKVLVSKNQWVVEQAIVWRHWAWSGYRFRSPMGIVRSYSPKDGKLIKADKIRNFYYYSPYHMTDENMKMYLDDMISRHIVYLRGYPSSLRMLASYVNRTQHAVPRLKGIFSASEVLSDQDRLEIKQAFGIEVTNWYGLAECVVTMGDCERHKGMHIFEEYGYVELIETEDENKKKVIGTNLHNYAMPLLRYETNDIALVTDSGCDCERTSRVVDNIIGRSNSTLKLKDREIPLTNFFTLMEKYHEVGSWQIVQRGIAEVELISEHMLSQETRESLANEFSYRLPENIDFYISEGKDFVKTGEGKKNAFINVG